MNYKHSKYFNTAILFESLLIQGIKEKIGDKKNISEQIIKESFHSKSELLKDLSVYEIIKEKGDSFDRIVNLLEFNLSGIDRSKLKTEHITLINKLKDSYNLDKLLSNKIPDYKRYASIYILLDKWKDLKNLNPIEYNDLIESITN